MVLAHLAKPIAIAIFAFDRCLEIIPQQGPQMFGLQYLLRHLADDDAVELVHRHAQPLAAERAFLEAARAAVITILPALAGVLDEGCIAMAAAGYTRKQCGRIDSTRCHPFGRAALEQRLSGVEGLLVDNGRHGERDPFGRRTRPAIATVGAVEMMLTMIGGCGQDVVNAARGKSPTAPHNAPFVEPGGNRFHAHGTPLGAGRQIEDHPDDPFLGIINDQHLLFLGSTPLGDLDAIAEWRTRPIPKALTGVFQHGAVDVFRGFTGLMFIEDVEHLAEHLAAGVLRHLLGDRDQFDPGFAQLTDVEFRMERIPAEPAQRMDDHQIEGMIRALGGVDQLLKHRAILVECGCTRFREDLDHLDVLPLTPAAALSDLIWDRQITLGLPGG